MRLRQRMWRAIIDRFPEGTKLPILSGPLRGWGWHVSHHVYRAANDTDPYGGVRDYGYISGRYEPLVQAAFIEQIRPGTWVYDIGAHHGFYSLLALRLGANVVTVEGDPQSLKMIELNVLRSQETWPFGQQEVRVHRQYATADTDWSPFPAPDLVKIDVDGPTAEVLTGVLRHYRPRVILAEVWPAAREACQQIAAGYSWSQVGVEMHMLTRVADGQSDIAAASTLYAGPSRKHPRRRAGAA
jgi:hypothetical protein